MDLLPLALPASESLASEGVKRSRDTGGIDFVSRSGDRVIKIWDLGSGFGLFFGILPVWPVDLAFILRALSTM
jgi:hypothetical protein